MSLKKFNQKVIGCTQCPRLVEFREEISQTKKKQFQDDVYWGKPVPSFGDPNARMMIVGLAPAPHGSNRTGRMFTGDGTDGMGSSDFLMRALHHIGYANQPTSQHIKDGLKFTDAYMTAIVRCAPPANKPTSEEIKICSAYLHEELKLMKNLKVIVALGKLAFDQLLRTFQAQGAEISKPRPQFGHGVEVHLGGNFPILLGSYHPSRQNTQTGKLSETMLQNVFSQAKRLSSHPF